MVDDDPDGGGAGGLTSWELAAREGVRDTVARYTFGGDRGRLADLAACFTPEGVLHIGNEPPCVGPAAIIERLGRVLVLDPSPTHVHHTVSGLHFVSVGPEAIETSAYFTVLTQVGVDHWGRYRDRLVPVGGGWLFAQRRVTTVGYAADSLFQGS